MGDFMSEENIIKLKGIMSQGYGMAPKAVMRDTRLTIEAKAIYSYMSSFSGCGERAFPSVKLQLHDLGISKTRYYKHRKLLEQYGYITIQTTRTKNENNKSIKDKNIYIIEQFPIEKTEHCKEGNSAKKFQNSECPQNEELHESVENTNFSECPHFEDTQNEDIQNEDIQNRDTNNISSTNNNITNNNITNKISKVQNSNNNYIQKRKDLSSSDRSNKKTLVPEDSSIDKYIRLLIKKDKAFKSIDFNNGDYYMAFIESITITQIQDNVDVISMDQWRYFRTTLLNKVMQIKEDIQA